MLIRFEVPAVLDQLLETPVRESVIAPNTDVMEAENETAVVMELPGVEKSDLKLSFERGILTMSGERKSSTTEETIRVLLRERTAQRYHRVVRIHHPVEAGSIEAHLEHGILRVTLPKAEAAKPRVIEVR